jgi:hypothetical protein
VALNDTMSVGLSMVDRVVASHLVRLTSVGGRLARDVAIDCFVCVLRSAMVSLSMLLLLLLLLRVRMRMLIGGGCATRRTVGFLVPFLVFAFRRPPSEMLAPFPAGGTTCWADVTTVLRAVVD